MRYVGGKSRTAKHIAGKIASMVDDHLVIYEPFCGGCGATKELSQQFDYVKASDTHYGLIEMWKGLQESHARSGDPFTGFPTHVTEEDYNTLRVSERESPLRTFVSFGASFGGKEWGGYARNTESRIHYQESQRNVMRFAGHWEGVVFNHGGYLEQTYTPGSPIYCDPPYQNTTGYKTGAFDHEEFWQWVRDMTLEGHRVFVSEYQAPDDMVCIWEKPAQISLGVSSNSRKATEKLFIYDPRIL